MMDYEVKSWRYFVRPGITVFSSFNEAGIEKVDMVNLFKKVLRIF